MQHSKEVCYGRGQDSTYKYFEVILVDIAHTAIRKVCFTQWLCLQSHASGGAWAFGTLAGASLAPCSAPARPSRRAH